jgi:predicted dehydrogenase
MPKPRDFRVIPGGKPSEAPAGEATSADIAQLLDRVRQYRSLLPGPPGEELRGLLADFEDAVEALRLLEASAEAEVQPRVGEYRRLIAELDAEIVAAWLAEDSPEE